MPYTCYSYPGNKLPDSTRRDAAQAARRDLRNMPNICYSYPAMCFRYPGDAPSIPPGLRGMPFGSCFRY